MKYFSKIVLKKLKKEICIYETLNESNKLKLTITKLSGYTILASLLLHRKSGLADLIKST
jgi:hypothetical protein